VSPEGIPLGGEFMIIINQELHLPLVPRWTGLVFLDAGNVWLTRGDFEPTLLKSVGVGLRYASPVGPLRLDWAFPLDRREGDPKSKVYIGFGPTF
jgi:outer membrane translocation and assembly module TamA